MSPKSFDPRPLFYQLTWKERITAWVILVVVFMLFTLYAFELPIFGNTFQFKSLLLRALLIFGIFGGIAGYIYSKPEKDLTEKFKVFLFIFLSALFFAPLLANLTNRWFSGAPQLKSYEIFAVEPIGTPQRAIDKRWSTRDYFIFVFEDDELEKIRLTDLTEEPLKGQQIELVIGEGLFGWKFLTN